MPIRIYESDYPEPFVPEQSVFDYILPGAPGISPIAWGVPDTAPQFIDAITGTVITHGGLRDYALRIAAGLRARGLQRGETVLLMGPNSLEWIQAAYGNMAAGHVCSPANAAYLPEELAHQINDSGASAIFIHPNLLPVLTKALEHVKRAFPLERIVLLCPPSAKPVGVLHAALQEIHAGLAPMAPERFDGSEAQHTAWLCYSSGTTGMPKGVMTTHFNLTSQMQAASLAWTEMIVGRDVMLGVLPMSHVYGLIFLLMLPAAKGIPVVMLPRWDEVLALKSIQKYKITNALIVPPIAIALLNSNNLSKYDTSSLRSLCCAAAPLGAEQQAAINKLFPNVALYQGYGMTECSPATHMIQASEAKGHDGFCGRLIAGWQARLIAPDGQDVPEGNRGELWLRGPCIMRGYHNRPEETTKAMEPGGWYRTGDVLVRDKTGWWKVVDRVKELIKYKGFQVAPAELEGLLLEHPKVADAAVVGVNDDVQGTELPRAYIVAKGGPHVNLPKEVQDWLAGRVAPHKKLRGGVVVIDMVPKSPSGKILRKDLRARAAEEYKKAGGTPKL